MKSFYILLLVVSFVTPTKLMDASTIDLLTPDPRQGEACGYNACPPIYPESINVHIVPSTQYDLGFFRTFYQHYTGRTHIRGYDSKINFKRTLDNIVVQLWAEPKRKFSLYDTPYFFKWWSERDDTVRRMVFQLLRQGRLYFIGGGWSMSDEATTSYHAIIEHFTYSLRKLNATFLECGRPLVSWQAEAYGHSREFTSLMAQMGFDAHFVSPISVDDELTRMNNKALDFVWRGSDDLGQETDIYTNKLFDGCNAPPGFCFAGLCNDPLLITSTMLLSNIDERVKVFMDSVLNRQSPYYSTKNVLIVMGERLGYYDAGVWFSNIDTLMDNVRIQSAKMKASLNIFYSTPACYLRAVYEANPSLSIKQDDFIPYESGRTSYVVGTYTSRPSLKYMIRNGHIFLQIAKQLQVLAHLKNNDHVFEEMMWIMGVIQDHNLITGGSQQAVIDYYKKKLFIAVQKSTVIVRDAINKLRRDQIKTQMYRCSFNESGCWNTEGEEFFIVVYNPLSWPVTKPIRLPVLNRRHQVYNHRGTYKNRRGTCMKNLAQPIRAALMRIPTAVLNLPQRRHKADHELTFLAEDLPPLGYRSYFIKSKKRTPMRRQKRSIIKKLKRNKKKKYLIKQTNPMRIDEESLLDKMDIDYEYFDESNKPAKSADERSRAIPSSIDEYDQYLIAPNTTGESTNYVEATKTTDNEDFSVTTPESKENIDSSEGSTQSPEYGFVDRSTVSPEDESQFEELPKTLPTITYKHGFGDKTSNFFVESNHFDDRTLEKEAVGDETMAINLKNIAYDDSAANHFGGMEKDGKQKEIGDINNFGVKSNKNYEKGETEFGVTTQKIFENDFLRHNLGTAYEDDKQQESTASDLGDKTNKYFLKSTNRVKPTRIPKKIVYFDDSTAKNHVQTTEAKESTVSPAVINDSTTKLTDTVKYNFEESTMTDTRRTNNDESTKNPGDTKDEVSGTTTESPISDEPTKNNDSMVHDTASKNPNGTDLNERDIRESTTTPFTETSYEDDLPKYLEGSDYDDEFYKKFFKSANISGKYIMNYVSNTDVAEKATKNATESENTGNIYLENNDEHNILDNTSTDVKQTETTTIKLADDAKTIVETTETEMEQVILPETRRDGDIVYGPIETTTDESIIDGDEYNYKLSDDLFIENKYIKLTLNKRRQLDSLVLLNGITISIDIEFYYYESEILTGEEKAYWDRNAGANVFHLQDGKAIPIKKNTHVTIFKSDLVEEMHCQVAEFASLVFRIYEDKPYLEIDWVAGPISVTDEIGKEIFIRYTTNLNNNGVFFTDSNGRQTIKRIRNRRATFTKKSIDPIAGNIYPVTSKIYIEDEEKNVRVSVLNDRAQGGTSLNDGQIDLFVHRRILTDDIGAGVYVNETYEDRDGIIVRGTHYLYVSKADYKPNKIFEKKFAKEIEMAPQIFVSQAYPYAYYSMPIWNTHRNEFSALNKKLPLGVHILTIEKWNDNTLLMRFENYLEKVDVYREGTKKVYLEKLFVHLKIYKVQETTLAGNIWLKDYSKKLWHKREIFYNSFNDYYSNSESKAHRLDDAETRSEYTEVDIKAGILLKPQQIRTFVVSFSYYGLS